MRVQARARVHVRVCTCACACAYACVRARVRVRVRGRVGVCVCACARACVRARVGACACVCVCACALAPADGMTHLDIGRALLGHAGMLCTFTVGPGLGRQCMYRVAWLERLLETKRPPGLGRFVWRATSTQHRQASVRRVPVFIAVHNCQHRADVLRDRQRRFFLFYESASQARFFRSAWLEK